MWSPLVVICFLVFTLLCVILQKVDNRLFDLLAGSTGREVFFDGIAAERDRFIHGLFNGHDRLDGAVVNLIDLCQTMQFLRLRQ